MRKICFEIFVLFHNTQKLGEAIQSCQPDIVESVLKDAKANDELEILLAATPAEATYNGGWTIFHYWAANRDVDKAADDFFNIAQQLVGAGVSLNAVDNRDRSALHIAAMYSNPSMIRLLLKAGAREDLVDYDDRKTPFQVARWVFTIQNY